MISVGFPMPKIAFLPVIILWLGLYDVAKIAMVVFDAMFPVVTVAIAGIAGVERELLWSARNMGANDRHLMWQILLPAALPQILTGLASGAAGRLDRRGDRRNADGRLRPRRRHDGGLALCRFARRVRRHRRKRRGGLRPGRRDGGAAAAPAGVA
jgi:Binding-protein-dependent transport system inner membrane component